MQRPPRVRPFVVSLMLAAGVASCSEPPAAPSQVGTPQPPVLSAAITGIVFETAGQTKRPLAGAKVIVEDFADGPYGWFPWYEATTDVDGRFTVANATAGRTVKITAYENPNAGPMFGQGDLLQVRGVRHVVGGGGLAEVELSRPGSSHPSGSPVLSGIVFERTATGLRPAADMPVIVSSNGHDGADAYTRTNADGRYAFWDLPAGSGWVAASCTSARTMPIGWRAALVPVQIVSDTEQNVTCP